MACAGITCAQRAQLRENGFVVIPHAVSAELTAQVRAMVDAAVDGPGTTWSPAATAPNPALSLYTAPRHTQPTTAAWDEVDKALAGQSPVAVSNGDFKHLMWHPFPDPLLADLVEPLATLNQQLLGAKDLKLAQQLTIRTDPSPPPHRTNGWHMDFHVVFPFTTPFFHCLTALAPVAPGQAAFTVLPGSDTRARQWLAGLDDATIERMKHDLVFREAQSAAFVQAQDTSAAQEVIMGEGDVCVFSLLLVHSASSSSSNLPRHAMFTTFWDAAGGYERIVSQQKATGIWSPPTKFSDAFRQRLPSHLRPLVEWAPVLPRL